MSQDRSSVEAVVNGYFDGLYEGDADKIGAVFHPSADLRWVEKGELKVLTVPDWLAWIKARSGKRVAAPATPGSPDHPALAPAPGTYVLES